MLEFMYITNNPRIASIADKAGVERVWIDLETIGKEERQGGMDSIKSHHQLSDIELIRPVLEKSKLQVRINPIHDYSKAEIDAVISRGVDYIMLPYYKTIKEVEQFIEMVKGRAVTILLLETREARECLNETLSISGVDEIHIGLNDLHISYGQKFMFELLADGTVEDICNTIKHSGKKYGFGGIARLGRGVLSAEKVLGEHYRLGSTRAILSRSFCNPDNYSSYDEIEEVFLNELYSLREYEKRLSLQSPDYFEKNLQSIKSTINQIINSF